MITVFLMVLAAILLIAGLFASPTIRWIALVLALIAGAQMITGYEATKKSNQTFQESLRSAR